MARRVPTWLVIGIVTLVGCAGRQTNDPPKQILARRWVEPDAAVPPGADKAAVEGLASILSGPPKPCDSPPRPLNILALSAGGKYAAHSAGVLAGWAAHGTLPTFDIVTGVSSGAIIAPYAFLGPQYDERIKTFFTAVDGRDLFKMRPVRNLIRYGSLATPDGLRTILEREFTPAFIGEIQAAHASGRRLYIATLNVHTKRLCVWDIGGIASSGRPDAIPLIHSIMLAATAVPGLLPPVSIDVIVDGVRYTETHADAGPVTQTFVRFADHVVAKPGTQWLAGSNLYCLAAGKLEPDPMVGRLSIFDRIGGSLSAALYALYKAELVKLYGLCVTSGMRFNLVSIPNDTELDVISTRVRAAEMKPLYEMGYRSAVGGPVWRQVPPGVADGEDPPPRTGTEFRTEWISGPAK